MTATISVISPNRADVVDQTSLAVGAGRDAVLNLGAQQVAYGNRGAGEPHLAATNVAGDYYLVVSLEAAEGAARVDVPTSSGSRPWAASSAVRTTAERCHRQGECCGR